MSHTRSTVKRDEDYKPVKAAAGRRDVKVTIYEKQKALLAVIFHEDAAHDTLDRLLACAGKVAADQTVG